MVQLRISFFFLISSIATELFSQTGVEPRIYRNVIRKNQPGKKFVFDYSNGEIADNTRLKYLGDVTTKHGITYKVLTSIWVWGYSKRGTTRLLLFDDKNRYVGNFVLGMTHQAPTNVTASRLIFKLPKVSGCDINLKSEISFADGIPKKFFLECKNGDGDTVYFEPSK